MKRKALSTVLSLTLALSCIPALALAAFSSAPLSESAYAEAGEEAPIVDLRDASELSLEDYGTFDYHKAVGDINEATPELASSVWNSGAIGGTYRISRDTLREPVKGYNAYRLIADTTFVFLKSSKDAKTGPTLTAKGADADSIWCGGAAINTNGHKLTIIGVGTLNAIGGNAAPGEDGEQASSEGIHLNTLTWGKVQCRSTDGGWGGSGGSGAGAGIGSDGGSGGMGGDHGRAIYNDESDDQAAYMNEQKWEDINNSFGYREGKNGSNGEMAGEFSNSDGLIVKGNVTINAKGGELSPKPQAQGGGLAGDGTGIQYVKDRGWPTFNYVTVASGAGGGGGGHGAPGAAIGAGGAGGGGGGGGASGGCGSGDRSSAYALGTAGGGAGGGGYYGGLAGSTQSTKYGGFCPWIGGTYGLSNPLGGAIGGYFFGLDEDRFFINKDSSADEVWHYFGFYGGSGGNQGDLRTTQGSAYATTLSGAAAENNSAAIYQAFPITECKIKVMPKGGSAIFNSNEADGSFSFDGSVLYKLNDMGGDIYGGPVFAFNGSTPEFDVVIVHTPTGEVVSTAGYSFGAFDASVGAATADDALSIPISGGEASTGHSNLLWKDGQAHSEVMFNLRASIKYDAELAQCQDPVKNWMAGGAGAEGDGSAGETGTTGVDGAGAAAGIQKTEGMVVIYNPTTDSYVNVPTSDFEIAVESVDPAGVGITDAGKKKVTVMLTAEQAKLWHGLPSNDPCTLGTFKATIKAAP